MCTEMKYNPTNKNENEVVLSSEYKYNTARRKEYSWEIIAVTTDYSLSMITPSLYSGAVLYPCCFYFKYGIKKVSNDGKWYIGGISEEGFKNSIVYHEKQIVPALETLDIFLLIKE